MGKKLPRPSVVRQLRLYEDDLNELAKYYPRIGYTEVIRRLISAHVEALRARLARNHPAIEDAVQVSEEEINSVLNHT